MSTLTTGAMMISLAIVMINISEIIRDPKTTGWGVGLGSLAFVILLAS